MSSPGLQQAEEWEERAKLLKELGRFEEAIAAQEKAIRLRESSIELDAEYWFERGNQQYDARDFEGAIASYDKALEVDPNNYQAWGNRGRALHNFHRFEEAIESYKKVLEINPKDNLAWHNRGFTLCDLHRFEEAIESYNKALEINPNSDIAWYNRGVALYDLHRFEEAIESYDKALEISPNSDIAWYNQGAALYNLYRLEEAIESYNKALEINPKDNLAWHDRGRALYDLHRFEEAIESYNKALEINPKDNLAWHNRGLALYDSHRFEEMIENYNIGLTHISQDTQPEGWGQLYRGKGNIYYFQAESTQDIRATRFYNQSLTCYSTALQTLKDFPASYLELIRDIIKVHLALREPKQANEWRIQGLEVFRQLLNQQSTTLQKRLLESKFSGFSQIAVDGLVSDNRITTALETADRYKNRCLTWILNEWKETVISPSYAEMRQLLKASTAIVYWHLSEDALTTFILTPHSEDPILLDSDRASLIQRQQKIDQWIQRWDKHYNDYRSKGKEQSESKANHPWRRNLKANLDELREILGIAAIEKYLSNISNLILVPHRGLHRFPLHALFSEDYTISYLPSLQVGLNLQQKATPQTKFLLNVEDPARDDIEPMRFAQLESAILRSLFSPNVKSISPNQSDRASVETALKENRGIFHFTGHGRYDPRQPENSELGLKGTDNLTAKEISHTPELANYHLVSLSACETGISGIQTIQTEYVGLASAFLTAGVSNVISTLWTVEEISNAYLMIRFYQFWLDGNSFARSLKLAQNWLRTVTNAKLAEWIEQLLADLELDGDTRSRLESQIRRIQKDSSTMNAQPYADPYHWAGFTLTGTLL